MEEVALTEKGKKEFVEAVNERSDDTPKKCYQCGKCTAGCPISFEFDYPVSQVIRMVQLGLKEKVLSSRAIWLCSSCETCSSRCPKETDPAKMMDVLRQMALKEKVQSEEESDIQNFHKAFLKSINKFGRLYEVGLTGDYKLSTLHLLQDIDVGIKMLPRGKLKFLPHKIKGIKQIKKIFEKCKES